jgi:hypothetical protein
MCSIDYQQWFSLPRRRYQNVGLMREATEKRASQALIPEDARPFLEWKIRCGDGG